MSQLVSPGEDTIDVKAYLAKFWSKWYWFLLTWLVAFAIAKIYLRYQRPEYYVHGTVLVNSQNSYERNLGGLGLFTGGTNLVDELSIVKSYDLIAKTLHSLPEFGITYMHKGDVNTMEWYKTSPIRVELDSASFQLADLPFFVTPLPGNKYRIQAEAAQATVYDLRIHSVEGFRTNVKINEVGEFGKPHTGEYFSFTLYLNNPGYKEEENRFYFSIVNRINQAQSYKNRLQVGPLSEKASILRMALNGPVVRKDIDFINAHMRTYVEHELDVKNRIAENTLAFINQQLHEIAGSLEKTENAMEKFRSQAGIVDFGTATGTVAAKLQTLEESKGNIQLRLSYYTYIREYIEANKELADMAVPSAIGIADPVFSGLLSQLVTMKTERMQLLISTSVSNPYVKDLDAKIRIATSSLLESITNVIKGEELTLRDLNRRIAEAESKLGHLTGSERDFLDIQRNLNLNNHLYNFLLEKRAEAGITKASNRPSHSIVDEARILSAVQTGPNAKLYYNIALMLGLFLPIGIILLMDFLNDKIKSKEELQKASPLPILGIVGHCTEKEFTNLIVAEKPKSNIAEAMRAIRMDLAYLIPDKERKIITVTSSISGEGKTFLSMNLATIYAISGKRVLLIGADLRKPKIFDDFNLDNSIGLTTYLSGRALLDKVIHRTQVNNLDLMLAGPVPPNPAELLSSDKMTALLAELSEIYEVIVIDTPPVGLVADAFALMTASDINLYVVRHNYTRKGMLDKVNDMYRSGKLKNMSLIVNDFSGGSETGYSYGYGYGYGVYVEDAKREGRWQKITKAWF